MTFSLLLPEDRFSLSLFSCMLAFCDRFVDHFNNIIFLLDKDSMADVPNWGVLGSSTNVAILMSWAEIIPTIPKIGTLLLSEWHLTAAL